MSQALLPPPHLVSDVHLVSCISVADNGVKVTALGLFSLVLSGANSFVFCSCQPGVLGHDRVNK
jgi:hypothetical protein